MNYLTFEEWAYGIEENSGDKYSYEELNKKWNAFHGELFKCPEKIDDSSEMYDAYDFYWAVVHEMRRVKIWYDLFCPERIDFQTWENRKSVMLRSNKFDIK